MTLEEIIASLWHPTEPVALTVWCPEPPITSARPGAGSYRWNPFHGVDETPEWRARQDGAP